MMASTIRPCTQAEDTAASCVLLFSGGLDSAIAAHLLMAQGIEVQGLHFILPFEDTAGARVKTVETIAANLHLPLQLMEDGEGVVEMLRSPAFGFGKHANPCIDCRIGCM